MSLIWACLVFVYATLALRLGRVLLTWCRESGIRPSSLIEGGPARARQGAFVFAGLAAFSCFAAFRAVWDLYPHHVEPGIQPHAAHLLLAVGYGLLCAQLLAGFEKTQQMFRLHRGATAEERYAAVLAFRNHLKKHPGIALNYYSFVALAVVVCYFTATGIGLF
ncbi:hypothetical protein E3E12_03385 [Formicincola oecophyllae]|uniref:Uncharacterized protein n=1 Tax=Formicincola oecophyllae TaxID=2558361 RepID=A0A4Y6U8A1_9PROT|nr:hypothetical protein [Formicincola oecophyllae]QDH13404.1 hypothetical protein E3E12_03385 [Formicincola oecophyllae]